MNIGYTDTPTPQPTISLREAPLATQRAKTRNIPTCTLLLNHKEIKTCEDCTDTPTPTKTPREYPNSANADAERIANLRRHRRKNARASPSPRWGKLEATHDDRAKADGTANHHTSAKVRIRAHPHGEELQQRLCRVELPTLLAPTCAFEHTHQEKNLYRTDATTPLLAAPLPEAP